MSRDLLNLGVSGMLAQGNSLAVIGNNIANSRTHGFKSERSSFAEAFYSQGAVSQSGTRSSFGHGVEMSGTAHDWGNGAIDNTGEMTHFAVVGPGFIPVTHGGETFYTRNGEFNLVETETSGVYSLKQASGAELVDASLGRITFSSMPDSVEIMSNGDVLVDGNPLDTPAKIGLQRFGNPDALVPTEAGLYRMTAAGAPRTANPEALGTSGLGTLMQGALEVSNVDLTREFAEMIAAQRAFQANAKTVTTADTMLQEVLALKR